MKSFDLNLETLGYKRDLPYSESLLMESLVKNPYYRYNGKEMYLLRYIVDAVNAVSRKKCTIQRALVKLSESGHMDKVCESPAYTKELGKYVGKRYAVNLYKPETALILLYVHEFYPNL